MPNNIRMPPPSLEEAARSRSAKNDIAHNVVSNTDDDDDVPSLATNNNNADNSNDLVAKKRAFTHELGIKRQAYHKMTSFRKFPLQEMAIRDVETNLKDYIVEAAAAAESSAANVVTEGSDNDGDDSSDDDNDDDYRQKEAVIITTATKATATAKKMDQKRPTTTTTTCQQDELLRKQFMTEFLQQKSMPQIDLSKPKPKPSEEDQQSIVQRDDNNGAPNKNETMSQPYSLTQEISDELDEIDALVDRHNGLVSDSDSDSGDENSIFDSEDEEEKGCNHNQNEHDTEEKDDDNNENSSPSLQLPILWSLEPRLFAMESALHGKRRYVSTHLGRFMDHYWRVCDVHNRHYYELIRENTPCRLYFDLEFNKQFNTHLTTDVTEDVLTELFDEIQYQFQQFYNTSLERSNMVDLDSSTAKKFSRHWIIHLPDNQLFEDAKAAGFFVKAMVSRLEKERQAGDLQAKGHELLANNLFVNAEECTNENSKPKLACMIDLGVYTRNRLFRILGSKKFGKTCDATLRIAASNEYRFPKQFDNTKFFLPEMTAGETVEDNASTDTRESGSDDDADADAHADSFEKFVNSMSWEAHAEALAATLVVPANSSKVKHPILTHPAELLGDDGQQQQQLCFTPRCGGGGASDKVKRGTPEYGKSPFPKLDHFIVSTLGQRKSLVGSIGTWTLDTLQPLPQSICYNMRDNRFCEYVGRAHKSNNIIWNVHLIDRVCWQTCHDPECRAAKFRGEIIDLPEEVNIEIDEYFLEHELSRLKEGELIERSSVDKGPISVPPNRCKVIDEGYEADYDDPELELAMLQLNISNMHHQEVKTEDENDRKVDESSETWHDDDKLDSQLLEMAKNLCL